MTKHEFIPVTGHRSDTCYDCGQYYEEGDHYPYNPESIYLEDEDDELWQENTVRNYETDEEGF